MSIGDMAEYLGVFLDEAQEQVQTLDEGIIRLEKEPDNPELLQEIFRAAHSLKSSSAAMGFTNMSRLTHAAESVLDTLRSGAACATSVMIDSLLAAVDALKSMETSIRNGLSDELEVGDIIARLKGEDVPAGAAVVAVAACEEIVEENGVEEIIVVVEAAAPIPATEPPTPPTASLPVEQVRKSDDPAQEEAVRQIAVRLSTDCQMKSVRARIILNNLQKLGTVIRVDPSEEQLGANPEAREISISLQSKGGSEVIQQTLAGISEIESFQISPDERVVDAGPTARGKSPTEVSVLAKKTETEQTVRVNVARLDKLMNLVGELVLDRTRIAQLAMELEGTRESMEMVEHLRETSLHMGRVIGDLQEEVMRTRLLPIAQLFRRFPRMVRDIAQKMGKEIELAIEGEETELDRSVIEAMVDPLSHLLRNSLDHGIELPAQRIQMGKSSKGTIRLCGRQEENNIVIEIADDGAGINSERLKASAIKKGIISTAQAETMSPDDVLQLIFAPGLSTAEAVSDVSGRGVGMDVVKSNVNRLHGRIQVESTPCLGTTVTVRLPLTLAISQALLVKKSRATVAIPLIYVVETVRIATQAIKSVHGRLVMNYRDQVLPLISLNQVLGDESGNVECTGDQARIVVVRSANQDMGIMVDRLLGEQEIVLKPLGSALGDIAGMSGATILGNGTVALVVDVASLIERVGLQAASLSSWQLVNSAVADSKGAMYVN
jgi:two-component system, chemotaxis family, sensor kinase CheA